MARGAVLRMGGDETVQTSTVSIKAFCNPPLGRATVIPISIEDVYFTVLIESPVSTAAQTWQAAIWCRSKSDATERTLALKETKKDIPVILRHGETNIPVCQRFFVGKLEGSSARPGPLFFKVKYQTRANHPWRWANDDTPLDGGDLLFQRPLPNSDDLLSYIPWLHETLDVELKTSEAPDTKLWSLTIGVERAKGKVPGRIRLEYPIGSHRWMGLTRLSTPWIGPEHHTTGFHPHRKDVVMCSFLRKDGLHLIFLPLSGVDDVKTMIRSSEGGHMILDARNDGLKDGLARILVSVGTDYQCALAATMYHARKLVQGQSTMTDEALPPSEGIKPQWMQNWYDGLTYCTYNGLGRDLSEDLILDALESLKHNQVHISNLLIDDNWQSLDNDRGWVEFEANREGFPNGLKHTVNLIRKRNPELHHIGVWHALCGYWEGISPTGQLGYTYKTHDVRMKRRGGSMTVIAADDLSQFYDDFYRFLTGSGIDFVKTDVQCFLDDLEDADDRRNLIKSYQDAWAINHLRWFSDKAISSMSQVPPIMFHSQLPTNKPRIPLRNSDDFFPAIDSSHTWHVFCNAHNALLTRYLNVLPDWDMFQTSHTWGGYHAAARCVSGGPIAITDVPGQHDTDLIQQMTAPTINGQTVILRPDAVGKTTQQYNAFKDHALLKIGTYVRSIRSGILGVFNVNPEHVMTEFMTLEDFPGTNIGKEGAGEYIIRAHTTGTITPIIQHDSNLPSLLLTLPSGPQGWEILTCYPLQSFSLPSNNNNNMSSSPTTKTYIATLGLLGKLTGSASIVSSTIEVLRERKSRIRIVSLLKALGILGIYISHLDDVSIDDDVLVLLFGKVVPKHTVRKSENGKVLEIDLEKAWREMGLDQKVRVGNEVGPVAVFISWD